MSNLVERVDALKSAESAHSGELASLRSLCYEIRDQLREYRTEVAGLKVRVVAMDNHGRH